MRGEEAALNGGRSERLPPWIRKGEGRWGDLAPLLIMLRRGGLHTVCQTARCPNIRRCFSSRFVTFLILGDVCSRDCAFCGVHKGVPGKVDEGEPFEIARLCREFEIRYAVITSVTRDDLSDGGAAHFAAAVRVLKEGVEGIRVEVLVPDFKGGRGALTAVLRAEPDVLGHNMETVERLYREVRRKGDYRLSLSILKQAKETTPHLMVKSGIMVGLGENLNELKTTIKEIRGTGCDILTVGQYLRPSKENLPVRSYYPPEFFEYIREYALSLGFRQVASGPLVRSSFMAGRIFDEAAAPGQAGPCASQGGSLRQGSGKE